MAFFGRKRSPPRAPPQTERWPLDAPLVRLDPGKDSLTTRDILAGGIQIWGGTGSGKTSGPMATLIKAMLAQGWALLMLCIKREDAETYIRYATEAGREQHIVRITPDGNCRWRFNWLAYELQRPDGGQIENVLHLLTSVLTEIVEGKQIGGSSDPYWERASKMLLRNALALLSVAEGTIRLDDIARLVTSAPQSLEQVQDASWQARSYCAQIIAQTDRMVASNQGKQHGQIDALTIHEISVANRFFLQEFAAMSDRTRSSVISTLTASIDTLMHGVLYRLFGTDTTFVPELLNDGAIIILDVPMVTYGEVARISASLLKLMTQRALLRRDVGQNPRPIGVIADESQHVISPFDWEFAAMSRSAKAMTLYATQSLQNYHARLGIGSDAAVRALLAQFQTQIFCRNNDVQTNNYAAELIARRWANRMGSSSQQSMDSASHGTSTNQSLEFAIQPSEFLHLRNGGPHNRFCVDSVLVGRTWSHGDVFLPVTFHQR